MKTTRWLSTILLSLLVITLVAGSGCIVPGTGSKSPAETVAPVKSTAQHAATTPPPAQAGGTCPQSYQTWCNGHCSDLSVDIGNCGACGIVCPSGQVCQNGQCSCKGDGKIANHLSRPG